MANRKTAKKKEKQRQKELAQVNYIKSMLTSPKTSENVDEWLNNEIDKAIERKLKQ